jgi:hypothetical protein
MVIARNKSCSEDTDATKSEIGIKESRLRSTGIHIRGLPFGSKKEPCVDRLIVPTVGSYT